MFIWWKLQMGTYQRNESAVLMLPKWVLWLWINFYDGIVLRF